MIVLELEVEMVMERWGGVLLFPDSERLYS